MSRRTLIGLVAGLLVLAAWEAGGLDLALSAWAGGAAGFPLRQHLLTRTVLHDGGRWLALAVLAALVADAIRPIVAGPTPNERRLGVLIVVVALLAVPALKRFSATSCPWDLAAFGGTWPYVPHWRLGSTDGGPGHCFPSGHAVSAFAFLGAAFAWQRSRPGLARAWMLGVVAFGLLFGAAQLLRGAHYLSHTLWSAWLCWAVAAGGWALLLRWPSLSRSAPARCSADRRAAPSRPAAVSVSPARRHLRRERRPGRRRSSRSLSRRRRCC